MRKYIFRRILLIFPMLFAVSVFIFALLRLSGSDAVTSFLVSSNLTPNEQNLAYARGVLGLDKPILDQYFIWMKNAITLDFGRSFISGREISTDVAYYFPQTLKLAGFALFLTLFISIPLGILSAVFKDKFIDNIIRVFAFVGVSAPNFWLGFLLIMLFSVKFDLLPPFGDEGFSSLLMPGFAIAYMSIAINTRLIRANMLEIFSARHVLYAKMRGLSKFRVIFAHVFKNALIPVITAIGMHVGELIGGALVVENVFAYPGLGRWAIEAIANNDYPIIQAFILIMAFAFIVGNLVIDIIYALIDPRVRFK